MKDKTHFRKAFNSPYLSSADIVEPTRLTISHVCLRGDATKKTKDLFNTAYFVEKEIRQGEKLKPMILNATNSKCMAAIAGSPFIDDWANIPVIVFVDPNVRFGRSMVEGLRIKEAAAKKTLTRSDKLMWDRAIQSYKNNSHFDAVIKHVDMTEEDQKFIIDGVANGEL